MAEPFLGRDWRSPGDQWVHTASGWKRLVELASGDCERTEKDTDHQPSSLSTLPPDTGGFGSVVEKTIETVDTISSDYCQHKNTDRFVMHLLKVLKRQ